ncbi:hypothetical protein [Mucilaginibacter polytrichastri]|uniref:Uncharacterized protein n=1 Tax=Mucilaginibacter polytrichastri TaxID=1302689 RepID=A0A1Q6A6E8_9SPHI|nr:hypothetical protein [Mucilaginibacter polytrichastri]OKS89585.1 hypothetical protein RG47T_5069 [Mucilaginibacter polytrichastri]SFS69721.1 hypothetical protein SAMN04487890_10329 [Mucilaginibacter polytrichastri]
MDFVVIALIIIIIVIVIPVLLGYLFYRWLAKKGYKKVAVIILCGVFGFFAYNIYFAVYPGESFYEDEFKNEAFRDLPKTTHFLKKEASYPDFHGKYGTAFLIEVSKDDFNRLESQLLDDKRFKREALHGSAEITDVMRDYNEKNIVTGLARDDDNDRRHYCFIGFFKDKRTIIVHTDFY